MATITQHKILKSFGLAIMAYSSLFLLSCSDNLESSNKKVDNFNKPKPSATVQIYGQRMSALGVYSYKHLRRALDIFNDPTGTLNANKQCTQLKKIKKTNEQIELIVEWSKVGCSLSTGNTSYTLHGREHFKFKVQDNMLKSISYSTRNLNIQFKNRNFQYQVNLEMELIKEPSADITFSGTHSIFLSENSPNLQIKNKSKEKSTAENSENGLQQKLNTNDQQNAVISVTGSEDTIKIDPTSLEEFFEKYREKRALTPEELLLDPIYAQFLENKRKQAASDNTQLQSPQFIDLIIDTEFKGLYKPENLEITLTEVDTEVLIENFRLSSRDRKTVLSENHIKLKNSNQGTDREGTASAISLDSCGNATGIMEYELDYNKTRKDSDYFFLTQEDFLFQKNQNKLSQIKCVKSHNPSIAALLNSLQRLQNTFNGGGVVLDK
jgi:hypothetical protein